MRNKIYLLVLSGLVLVVMVGLGLGLGGGGGVVGQ